MSCYVWYARAPFSLACPVLALFFVRFVFFCQIMVFAMLKYIGIVWGIAFSQHLCTHIIIRMHRKVNNKLQVRTKRKLPNL
jgi:hypothetical protein